ncbi:protein shisa-1-like [Struthio camelus]|uniref:protein shisa-1-like n=1 Tax=Struthio camelus TaxID=8801 RepID=UPI003603CE04
MARGLLMVLLLAALQGSPGWAGEYCHGGAGSPQDSGGGFQCPERHDGPEAAFCCGSCRLRYCCASRAARLDQGLCPGTLPPPGPRPPAPVPVYLPFLLVGSVFVAFVVGGIFVGICCCKCLKSQGEEQQRGLAPGQTWLLEPDLPSRLPSSSCATRSSLGSSPQMSHTCMNPSPSLPVIRFTEDALFLNAPPTSGRFLHPSHTGHGIPADHTAVTPASFLKRTVYGHSANASTISAAHGDQKMYLGVSCLRR